ncbi:MAG: Brp/Blh family beta-carotene 15,15'-dioxygenase [Desulfobacterales bacterium]|nr:Brp/Blh family beta-carotene 15,15'-dioxygenase [Desulfobacterales bacterium]
MDSTRPYEIMTTVHSLAFIGIAAVAIILNKAGLLDTIERQLILLAVLLPFAGIPHGSLDYSIARDMLEPRLSRLWSMTFLSAYLALMLAVLLAWQTNPTASLAAFLGITAFHFGSGDTLSTSKAPLFFRMADMVGRGGVVLTMPALFYADDVGLLFSYLIPSSGALWLTNLLGMMAPFAALAVLGCTVWYGYRFVLGRKRADLVRSGELVSILIIFYLLPALLAFTVYFTFLHSIRHLLYVAESNRVEPPAKALVKTYIRSIPITIVTILLAFSAYFIMAGSGLALDRMTQVIFIGIASVTYPHVAVIIMAQRGEVLGNRSMMISI